MTNTQIPSRASTSPPPRGKIKFGQVPTKVGHRVLLYGPAGSGKSTLACLLPGKSAIVDSDESLPILRKQLEESGIEIPVTIPATDWLTLQGAYRSDGWDGIDNIIEDTETKIEEWARNYMLSTVRGEKGKKCEGIEDYGFGKGYEYLFETFLSHLGDLDRHVRAGRNVVLICHDCVNSVPNPSGNDWIRYEPRLQDLKSGKSSIRRRLIEWCDHVLFVGYDVVVDKDDKKAQGHGSRTLYTAELPSCLAKSRTTTDQINIKHGVSPWDLIIK